MNNLQKIAKTIVQQHLVVKSKNITNQTKFVGLQNQFHFATMQTQQQTIIYGKKPQQQVYDREYFRIRSQYPNFEQDEKDLLKKQQQEEQTQFFLQSRQNDKNPNNYISNLKVNTAQVLGTAKIRQKRQFNLQSENQDKTEMTSHPFVLIHKPKEPKITVTGIRRNVRSTLKKLRNPLKIIAKKHVFDAMSIVQNMGTKASRYVLLALKQVLRHAKQQDMDLNRMYVNGAMMGKQRRFKLLYYKAKSGMGVMNKDIVQIRLTLEEKPIQDMYKEILVGKTPPSLAFILRDQLKEQQADFQTIRKWSHILTAKGRQQRRLMFKRRVIQKQQEYLRYGVKVEKKVIAKKLLEVESAEWAEEYQQRRLMVDDASINRRREVYEKNEKIVGLN